MEKGRMCEQRNMVGLPSKVGVGNHGLTGESVGDGAGAGSAVLVAGQDGVVSAWGEVPVAVARWRRTSWRTLALGL